MSGLIRSAASFVALLVVVFASFTAVAADRSVSLLPDTDLPGHDYSTVKNTTLNACQSACSGDNLCRAFTFNSKSKWCFLKGAAGDQATFKGATSGLINLNPTPAQLVTERASEIPFPAQDLIDYAKSFADDLPTTDTPPKELAYSDLVQAGDQAMKTSNPGGAMTSYRQALAINANDPGLWLKLANAAIAKAEANAAANGGSIDYDTATTATYAAVDGLLLSESVADRAALLGALARGLEDREMWRESIATYRASVALVDDATLTARLDKAVAEHGFRMTSNEVDADSDQPQICAVFSDPLPGKTDLSQYVVVDGAPQAAVSTQDAQICITGVEHGKRYHIKLRAGLPSADGEALRSDVDLNLYVPDRQPFVGFANNAYVMPAGLGGGLPITSVNAKSADVTIYRIGDRSIAQAVRNGIFQGTLSNYSAYDVANQYGEQLWTGTVDLASGAPNALVTTAIPVSEVLKGIAPGAYVVTATVTGAVQTDYYNDLATQWFIVTDLGMSTVSGDDGVHVFVRSLTTAQPVANSKVRLIAVNNEVLGEATSDASGEATFAPGLARGDGGRAPQLVVAETDAGDYAFLDLSKSSFDLTDRGVTGRPSPGPLDVFATTERGVYRPGETVFLTALLRDAKAKAVTGVPLTVEVERPDGVTASKQVLNDMGAGGYFLAVPLVQEAMRGSWHIRLYADPKAAALANVNFLVEDFEPERLAFDISAPDEPLKFDEPTEIAVAAKYLYGATAPGLDIEADTVISAVSTLAGFPGYTFGREDDDFGTDRESLGSVGTTDDEGNATAEVTLPATSSTTRPLQAEVILDLVDTNGRTVERSLKRPVLADTDRIGVKPKFDDASGLAQGSAASFDVIAVSPDGQAIDKPGLTWTLSRVETNYEWYRDNGVWKWEEITTNRKVADGTIDASASGPVTISGQVDYGEYLLEVNSDGENPTSTSYEFYAGYYYAQAGSNTPDTLKVALDKPAYKAGDTANLTLDPQFAGTALVMVVDDRIIDMKAVEVPAGGTTVELPVTADWGPGAYVVAELYRPASAAEKRMPARALGLAFADVDPGEMKLGIALDAPKVALPREPFTVKVKLDNVKPGDKAYVTVAAVDLGILNITNFQPPAPDDWYFGQRALGVEFRDLYGQLIDPTQGALGALHTGGDEGAARLGTPPPTSVLVALDTGIVAVGDDGTATVSFDMPDFAGTVRLMAMAWTASAVGHKSEDVIVRDPVVVTLSPPRFLRINDHSRLLLEINNVSGPAGTYKVDVTTGDGLSVDAPSSSFDLAAGARTSLDIGLTGTAPGDNDLKVTITLPDGTTLVKDLVLGVRPSSGSQTTSEVIPIAAGATITLDASRFNGLLPHTSSLTLAVGSLARLDVPLLLEDLYRYPYGCAEQLTSTALPLLYLNDVAKMIGQGSDGELDDRVKGAIQNLLAKQTSNGGFGLWSPSDGDELWLDAYVTDFLLRAKDKGFAIPDLALQSALDNLGNQVSAAADFDKGGEDIAYALYDLAKAGRAAIGDLRYYYEARLDHFGSPLAQAQLGAALALYGDRTRAAGAFEAALAGLKTPDDPNTWRDDYGSQLRDTAAVLTLAAETTPTGVDLGTLAARLTQLRDRETWTSTQEDAWTLLAASALGRNADSGAVTVDGEPLTGQVYLKYDQEHFDGGTTVTVANTSNQPTEAKVSVTGIPATPPPATDNGFSITRAFMNTDGTDADMSNVHQNDRFVVVLTATPTRLGSGRYVIADPLPAGFEIENPDLTRGDGTSDYSWLTVDTSTHSESRTDQYVAAYSYTSDTDSIVTAYLVRATTPGTFVLPGATVEDMYKPELHGNTDAGTIEVLPPGK